MKKLLSNTSTKDDLSAFLADSTLTYAADNGFNVVVAWKGEAKASHTNVSHLSSNHEEADTKLMLHAVDATTRGATYLNIYSLDTDVFVLSLRRLSQLPPTTLFCTGTGKRYREIDRNAVGLCLDSLELEALPGSHAYSGADVTGTFSGKGKLSFWKAFKSCDKETKEAFTRLGKDNILDDSSRDELATFTCALHTPEKRNLNKGELRWYLFSKKQIESERLPPTMASLNQAILRAHFQAIVWNHDITPNPLFPSPVGYGWKKENGSYQPVMTTLPPAPMSVIELIKCNCVKMKCKGGRCKYK